MIGLSNIPSMKYNKLLNKRESELQNLLLSFVAPCGFGLFASLKLTKILNDINASPSSLLWDSGVSHPVNNISLIFTGFHSLIMYC